MRRYRDVIRIEMGFHKEPPGARFAQSRFAILRRRDDITFRSTRLCDDFNITAELRLLQALCAANPSQNNV